MIIGHLDVVEARKETDRRSFQVYEKDGYFYGRGTQASEGERRGR